MAKKKLSPINQPKSNESFIMDLTTVFPDIREEVLDEDYLGLVSLQIGCFRRFTQRAIDRNDLITVKKCFDFADENMDIVEFAVENSLVISYLGKLNILENSTVEKMLSTKFKDLRAALASYYESSPKYKKQ